MNPWWRLWELMWRLEEARHWDGVGQAATEPQDEGHDDPSREAAS